MPSHLMTCTFSRSSRSVGTDRWHAAVLYALHGETKVRVVPAGTPSSEATLSPELGDIMVVNAGTEASLDAGADALAAVFLLDVRQVRRMVNDHDVWLTCNPTLRHQERYGELRHHLQSLIRSLSETSDFASLRREAAELDVVRCLLDGFAGTVGRERSRAEELCAYVDAHYDEPIGLADVARHFHLSHEYLAKVFRREVGQTMLGYLTSVRLDVACSQLAETDHTVSRVALESGFPNVASLNRAFRRAFGTTPSEWRKGRGDESRRPVQGTLAATLLPQEDVTDGGEGQQDLLIDLAHPATSLRPWRDMLGIGSVEALREARVREQVAWLYRRLGLSYGRVDCDFGRYQSPAGLFVLEDCFDFLLTTGIVPHVCMSVGPDADVAGYAEAVASAIRHFANRYSVDTVRSWRFELRARAGVSPADPAFLDLFGRITANVERLGVADGLYGPGCPITSEAGNIREFLRAARTRGIRLGGVTIAVRPTVPAGGGAEVVRTADRRFVRNQVLLAREALEAEGWDPGMLLVGGWSDTLGRRNVMNDACFEGANICQQLLSCQDLVRSICYDWSLDALCPVSDSLADFQPLSGKPGLLTRDGIPKPSFAACEFLSRVGDRVVYASERCVASANEMGNLQVVCHNCERLGARYLATPERDLSFDEMHSYFEEPGPRRVRIRISHAKEGTYLVKKRFVNAQGGSVADAAARMSLWCLDSPGRSEVEYLRACSNPQIELEVVLSEDGILDFTHELKSNEVAYFHIIYLY